ncbi:MAG TPA: hypothetical protein VLL27_08360 [Solirubrobacterales bacterium]|nr:hypothetical protein [Solirubrobacterales bacterium]
MAVIEPPAPPDQRLDDLSRRLDELSRKVDEGFRRVDEGFRKADEDFREQRQETQQLRSEMNLRLDSVQRATLQIGAGLFGTMFIGFLGVIAAMIATGP